MGCLCSKRDDAARSLLQAGGAGDFEAAFSLGEVLGKGSFAQVQAARRRADDARVAVKIVSLEPPSGQKPKGAEEADEESCRRTPVLSACMCMEEVVSELANLSAVQGNEHVVNLVSAMVEGPRVFIVMERCEIDISSKVSESPGFWALQSQRVMKEMLLGLQACHLADITHRDIKPQNFLLGPDGSTVKLCDFGLAARTPRRGQLWGMLGTELWGMVGTVPFASPEMLRDEGYGKATDMWSYGVTVYLLCFGVYPFPFGHGHSTHSDMKNIILLGLAPRFLQKGGGAAAFIKPQLERCKSARCTVEEALAHWHLQEDPSASPKKNRSSHLSVESEATTVGPGRGDESGRAGTASSSTDAWSSPCDGGEVADEGRLVLPRQRSAEERDRRGA